jgi:hypothetical protein
VLVFKYGTDQGVLRCRYITLLFGRLSKSKSLLFVRNKVPKRLYVILSINPTMFCQEEITAQLLRIEHQVRQRIASTVFRLLVEMLQNFKIFFYVNSYIDKPFRQQKRIG